ncbi:amino acid ABC transporter permease [uncultured Meiothermus sp.]|jgi:hypothetical protein|uniref:amino acid ABC transporter permease n=1 Tax=uncultured Meiothermus sp. TaxID=157471 RepID=UPI00260E7919|nr:amino acid ABC transporter permease [uncultured Meiothermus sp.]
MAEVRGVISKPSIQTYAVAAGLIGMGAILAALAVAGWLQGAEPRWTVILFGILGLYMVFLGVDEGWLSGLEVTPTRLRIRGFGRWEEHSLKKIEAVDGLRDVLGGGMQMVLIASGRDPVRVPLRRYGNSGQLAQAVLDAVWLENEDVIVMPRLLRRLGTPPFGVLGEKKSRR